MLTLKTKSMRTNASMIVPKEECVSLVCANVRRVGQASRATWQLSVQPIATTRQGAALLAHVSVPLASLGLPVMTRNVQGIVLVMEVVIPAPVIARRAGQVAPARTE
jgi:hypothetical protein